MGLFSGKKGLVFGVANKNSIAWGIAQALHGEGAELGFSYAGEILKKRVDPRGYNGAAPLGLRGLVFKSHGSADAFAFEQALRRAYDAARNRLTDRVRDRIALSAAALAPAPTVDAPATVQVA